MPILTKAYILALTLFVSRASYAQIDGRLKSKLVDLLYILVPFVFIVSTFLVIEWRRKKNVQTETVVHLLEKKKK